MTDFTIIFRSLSARLFSTVITILTVAVAVGLMLTLLSMRDAGEKAFERGSGNMHLLVSRDSSPLVSVLNGVFYASAPARPITWAEYERLVSPDSPTALPLEWAIPVQLGDSYKGQPVLATVPDFFTKFMPDPQIAWSFAEGRAFETEFEVVVGAAAARATGLKIGDSVTLTHGMSRAGAMGGSGPAAAAPHEHKEYAFKVVGILRPTGAAHDRALFINLNSSWILHAHDRHEAEEHAHDDHDHDHEGEDHDHDHDHDHAHEAKLTVTDLTDADRLITGIYMRVLTRPGQEGSAALPMVFRQLRADPTLTAAAPTDQIRNLFTIVSNIDDIVLAMAIVVMISSGIGIMLALYNSMEQRRRQIAVLRVLGCSRPRIFSLVLTESALLGAFGAAAGVLLCVVGGRLVAEAMKQRLGLVIEPALPLRETVAVVAGTILLACVAGLIPAFMAYRTPVARNLKPLG